MCANHSSLYFGRYETTKSRETVTLHEQKEEEEKKKQPLFFPFVQNLLQMHAQSPNIYFELSDFNHKMLTSVLFKSANFSTISLATVNIQ